MSNELKVKFWGVRGSYPTPGAGTIKYGGNTSSVEVRAGERTIILDAGTGIIPLGRELARSTPAWFGQVMAPLRTVQTSQLLVIREPLVTFESPFVLLRPAPGVKP